MLFVAKTIFPLLANLSVDYAVNLVTDNVLDSVF